MSIVTFNDRKPRDVSRFEERGKQILDSAEPLEAVCSYLRVTGCTIGESIRVTMRLTGLSHDDAKSAVYWSETWSACRPAIDQLHDACERAVVEMGGEVREVDERELTELAPGGNVDQVLRN